MAAQRKACARQSAGVLGRAGVKREWAKIGVCSPFKVLFFFFYSLLFFCLFPSFQTQTSIQIQTLWHFVHWLIIYFDHINSDEVIKL
jgi:hypothetical protein